MITTNQVSVWCAGPRAGLWEFSFFENLDVVYVTSSENIRADRYGGGKIMEGVEYHIPSDEEKAAIQRVRDREDEMKYGIRPGRGRAAARDRGAFDD